MNHNKQIRVHCTPSPFGHMIMAPLSQEVLAPSSPVIALPPGNRNDYMKCAHTRYIGIEQTYYERDRQNSSADCCDWVCVWAESKQCQKVFCSKPEWFGLNQSMFSRLCVTWHGIVITLTLKHTRTVSTSCPTQYVRCRKVRRNQKIDNNNSKNNEKEILRWLWNMACYAWFADQEEEITGKLSWSKWKSAFDTKMYW